MGSRTKNILFAASLLISAALGGAALAGAASNGGTSSSSGSTAQAPAAQSQPAPRAHGFGGQRPDETLLTGDAKTQVTQAAQAAVSGATIERVETDADGNAKYEAHMVKADGSRDTVYVDANYDVVSTEAGP